MFAFSSVARCIKEMLGYVGINTTIFQAHPFCSVTMSKAKILRISTKDIFKKRQLVWEVYLVKILLQRNWKYYTKVLKNNFEIGILWRDAWNRRSLLHIFERIRSECKILWKFYEIKLRNFRGRIVPILWNKIRRWSLDF